MVENRLRQCQKQRAQSNRRIQNSRAWITYFKLKCCILYLNFKVTLIILITITLSLCTIPSWINQEGEEQKAAGMHGSSILLSLSDKADGHAFKTVFTLVMIHNIFMALLATFCPVKQEEFRQMKHL